MIGAIVGDIALQKEKALGSLWGLIVGDCLGSPIQFTEKDGHPHVTEMVPCETFGTPPGYWTDDGSMALCVSTVEAALWALNTTASFEDALVAAVNLGGDADSIGAVCGQLAGAKYGVGAIPERWLAAVKDRAKLAALFDRFLAALDNAPAAS